MIGSLRFAATCIAICTVAGCGALPADGPSTEAVDNAAAQRVGYSERGAAPKLDFVLVDIDGAVATANGTPAGTDLRSLGLTRGASRDLVIGTGDSVRVTVFEAGSGGLFAPQGTVLARGNYVDIPDQEVLRGGGINVPYAGQVRAAGRRPEDVAKEIEGKLRNRAIEPQVVVSVTNRRSNLVTVGGDVKAPTRVPLTAGGDRVLDVISAAGGALYPDYETDVRVQRGGRQSSARLSALTADPAKNTFVAPGDVVYLTRRQRYFTVFGALGLPAFSGVSRLNVPITPGIARSALFTFDRESLSLADGLAKGGGLLTDRADPFGILLYRMEDRRTLTQLGADVTNWPAERVPTIYRLNVRDPSGFFLARAFQLRDDDLIYVAAAPIDDVLKISGVVRDLTAVVSNFRVGAGL